MQRERQPEPLPSSPDQPLRDSHLADQPTQQVGRWPIDRPFPSVLRDIDLMRALGIASGHFYARKARREFTYFELETLHQGRTEYSGHLVAEWLRTGELPRRFFKGARKPAVVRTGKPGRPRKLRVMESAHGSASPQRTPGARQPGQERVPDPVSETAERALVSPVVRSPEGV